jgi:hypothetical protein
MNLDIGNKSNHIRGEEVVLLVLNKSTSNIVCYIRFIMMSEV